MNNKKNYKKGMRKKIIQIILVCGFLNRASVHYIDGNSRVYMRKIHDMVEEGFLRDNKVKIGRLTYHILTLASFSSNLDFLQKNIGERECGMYKALGRRLSQKVRFDLTKTKRDSLREILLAEAELFATFSGAATNINNNRKLLGIDSFGGAKWYFNSREIRSYSGFSASIDAFSDNNLTKESAIKVADSPNKIKSVTESRFTGVLFSEGGTYITYNFGNSIIKISSAGETRIKQAVFSILCDKGEPGEINGAILAHDLSVFLNLQDSNNKLSTLNALGRIYDHAYVLPLSKEGREHFEIMQEPLWNEKILLRFFSNFDTEPSNMPEGCDAVNGEYYVNNFMAPDINKLYSFLVLAEKRVGKYVICCFDYQKPFITAIAEGRCDIRTLPLDTAKQLFDKGD